MNEREVALFETLCKFSDQFGVSQPQTKDVWHWWLQAVKEIDFEWIEFLAEHFQDCGNGKLIMMKKVLLLRKEKMAL